MQAQCHRPRHRYGLPRRTHRRKDSLPEGRAGIIKPKNGVPLGTPLFSFGSSERFLDHDLDLLTDDAHDHVVGDLGNDGLLQLVPRTVLSLGDMGGVLTQRPTAAAVNCSLLNCLSVGEGLDPP